MIFRIAPIWLVYLLLGCTAKLPSKTTTPKIPSSNISFSTSKGPVSFQISIADTDETRQKGLMNVMSLPENSGMLFIFPDENLHEFWMKDTYIPLDMIFMDKNLVVVGVIANAQPQSLERLFIQQPSKYVLEINAGLAKTLQIQTGTQGVR